MAILVALFFLVQMSSNPAAKGSNEAAIATVTPPTRSEVAAAAPAAPTPVAAADSPPPQTLPETASLKTPQALNVNCAWEPTEIEIQADLPRNKGEYVYVVALENISICIMDGNQRVANLSLKQGEARSIYGPGPFKVYSTQLAQVKLYFQGQSVKLPSTDIRQIKLKPVALP
jgi:hypothetical protein